MAACHNKSVSQKEKDFTLEGELSAWHLLEDKENESKPVAQHNQQELEYTTMMMRKLKPLLRFNVELADEIDPGYACHTSTNCCHVGPGWRKPNPKEFTAEQLHRLLPDENLSQIVPASSHAEPQVEQQLEKPTFSQPRKFPVLPKYIDRAAHG